MKKYISSILFSVFFSSFAVAASDFKQISFYQGALSGPTKMAGKDVSLESVFPILYAEDGRVYINVSTTDRNMAAITVNPKTDYSGIHFYPSTVNFKGTEYPVSGDCLMTNSANLAQLACLFNDTNNQRWEFTFTNLKLLSTTNK